MKRLVCLIMAVCIGLAMVASGSFAEEKKVKPLTDEGEVSYVKTDGNTQVTTLAVKNLMKYQFDPQWLGSWRIGATNAETAGVKTAENYFTDLKLDYQFTERFYSFVNAGWQQNMFAGIEERAYGGVGVGYKFLTGPAHFLVGELGIIYTADKYIDKTKTVSPDYVRSSKDYTGGRAFAKYTYAFTEKNKFSEAVEYLNDFGDSRNYKVNSETALISALNDILSLKAAYLLNYTNAPVPATLEKKDTTTTVALVLNY